MVPNLYPVAGNQSAGLSQPDMVETVANVVANIFSNCLNHVAEINVDFPAHRAGVA